LEYDHADIYADFGAYQLAFRRLVNLVPRRGRIVVWGDRDGGEALHRATEKAFCPVITYGLESGNDWSATDVQSDGDGMKFCVKFKGEAYGEFRLAASGHNNVLNALAALVVAQGRGIRSEIVGQALETFQSVRRRMDMK